MKHPDEALRYVEKQAYMSGYARGLADGRKEAANIPPDSIMLPDGRVVRVPGTLPMTADECVPTYGGFVYCPKGGKAHVHETDAYCTDTCCWSSGCQGDSGSGEHHPFSKCYSTRAAAEAAKEKP